MKIEIECDKPLDFGIDYYTVECGTKEIYSPCPICGGTHKVEIKGESFKCPKCDGGRDKSGLSVIETIKKYRRATWRLRRVYVQANGVTVEFGEITSGDKWPENETLTHEEIKSLCKSGWGVKKQFYTDRAECDKKVRELNKAERAKLGGEE